MTELQVVGAILLAVSGIVTALGTFTIRSFQASAAEWRATVQDLRAENAVLRAENTALRSGLPRPMPPSPGPPAT